MLTNVNSKTGVQMQGKRSVLTLTKIVYFDCVITNVKSSSHKILLILT